MCLTLWAAAVCVCDVAGYEDMGQASAGSGDFCKGGYATSVAAAAAAAAAAASAAQNKPASSVTGPGVGECRHTPVPTPPAPHLRPPGSAPHLRPPGSAPLMPPALMGGAVFMQRMQSKRAIP